MAVEPSALSQMINGKRPITPRMATRIGSALGLPSEKIAKLSNSRKNSDREFQQITLDTFAAISDWYHYAILELTYTRSFKPDLSWIARRLGITKSEANIATERLTRLGLLGEDENGKWLDQSENGQLTHLAKNISSSATKKYQSQLLELSKKSIYEVDLQKRNHTSMTLKFKDEDMAAAVEAIAKFRRGFEKKFGVSSEADEVYQLQISLFPLTKNGNEP